MSPRTSDRKKGAARRPSLSWRHALQKCMSSLAEHYEAAFAEKAACVARFHKVFRKGRALVCKVAVSCVPSALHNSSCGATPKRMCYTLCLRFCCAPLPKEPPHASCLQRCLATHTVRDVVSCAQLCPVLQRMCCMPCASAAHFCRTSLVFPRTSKL